MIRSSCRRRRHVRRDISFSLVMLTLVAVAAIVVVGLVSSPPSLSSPPLKGCQRLNHRSGRASTTTSSWRIHANTQGSESRDDTMMTMTIPTTTTSKQQHHLQQQQQQQQKSRKKLSAKFKGSSTSSGRSISSGGNANNYHSSNNNNNKNNIAARNFNSRLTGCNTVSELLSAFMDQTSSTSGGGSDNNNNNNNNNNNSNSNSSSNNNNSAAAAAGVDMRSAATHLAGANKANSVNFSTCLHRLARFAAATTTATTTKNSGHLVTPTNESEDDQRKTALSDPRFAILVCSMAEMACGCDPNLSIGEGNAIVESWKKSINHDALRAGGGGSSNISEMEEADDVLNAIADSHINADIDQQQMIKRRQSIAKAAMNQLSMSASTVSSQQQRQRSTNSFSSRECSNVCWALAKLRMTPPGNALPVGRVMVSTNSPESIASQEESMSSIRTNNMKLFVSIEEMALDVLDSSLQVRMKLYEEARSRKKIRDGSIADSSASGGGGGSWIPELSRLAGKVLDLIAVQIINEYGYRLRRSGRSGDADGDGRDESHDGDQRAKFAPARTTTSTAANSQEMASLLYAFAKAGRGDDTLFSVVAQELMRQTSKVELEREGKRGPKPQGTMMTSSFTTKILCICSCSVLTFFTGICTEFSNTIWAFATAGVRGISQVELIRFVADSMDEGNGLFFGFEFKRK